jgi:hypothetical protein
VWQFELRRLPQATRRGLSVAVRAETLASSDEARAE